MKSIREYKEENLPQKSLQDQILQNKTFPEKYRSQIYLALQAFPELANVNIRFAERKQWLPLASRPNWITMFRKKKNWEYLIIISTQSREFSEELLFHKIPFNGQIGILGHELSHTIYYLDKSFLQIFVTGIKYLNSGYRIKFEQETDLETIKRGLGYQLYDFAHYCRERLKSNTTLLNWLNKYYLKPEKILEIIHSKED